MARFYLLVITLCLPLSLWAQSPTVIGKDNNKTGPFRINGKVSDFDSRESLLGVNIFIEELGTGVVTQEDGTFLLVLDKGTYTLRVSFIGFENKQIPVEVKGNGKLPIRLKEDLQQLQEVVVFGTNPEENVKSADLGKSTLSIKSIQALPPLAGEVDILKSITLLPGVTTVGEVSSGFHVRGGGSDQNLILLGGATLYNPSHLFGFLSSFNADLISDVTLYKGGIPAKYGGRGSSILDLRYKTGDLNSWHGKASVGMVSSKLTLEGPIVQNKLSVLLGGRISYSDWLLKTTSDPDIKNSSAQFYDLNAAVNYHLNSNNKVSYSFYQSSDDFKFASDTTFAWTNRSHVLRWDHTFTERFTFNASLVNSQYNFSILNSTGINDFDLVSSINDTGGTLDLNYNFSETNSVNFGFQTKFIKINPGKLDPTTASSSVVATDIEDELGNESGAYIQHTFDLGKRLTFSYGVRYNMFRYLGSNTVNRYEALLPRNEENIIEQVTFGDGELIKKFDGFAPRASLRFSLGENSSIKMGYNKMYQYIHLISNTSTIAPTDVWKLSDEFLEPEIVTQYSIGLFKNLQDNSIETSIEAYYKDIENIVEYKDGADLILNNHLETELLTGKGRAYGIEFFFKKKQGRLTGWFSYTYSRSQRQVVGPYPEERINNGEWYNSNFDKPHDMTAVTQYNVSDRVSFSTIFTYSTGRPVTYPSAKFEYFGEEIAYYDERNGNRAPAYHRLDASLTFSFNARRKIWQGDWVLSVFNLYSRRNAFSVFFDDVPGAPPQAYQLSILGTPFPSLSYSVKF